MRALVGNCRLFWKLCAIRTASYPPSLPVEASCRSGTGLDQELVVGEEQSYWMCVNCATDRIELRRTSKEMGIEGIKKEVRKAIASSL